VAFRLFSFFFLFVLFRYGFVMYSKRREKTKLDKARRPRKKTRGGRIARPTHGEDPSSVKPVLNCLPGSEHIIIRHIIRK
jgi:hypothetical protein